MKKMRKWLALLLAVLMMVSLLAACGDSSSEEEEEEEEETTEVTTEATTEGTEATTEATEAPTEAPTVPPVSGELTDVAGYCITEATIDNLDFLWADYGDAAYGIKTISDDEGVLYVKSAEGEVVIEIVAQSAYLYYRAAGEAAFVGGNADNDTLNNVLEAIYALAAYSAPEEGVQYKQIADVTLTTGPAYAYEVYTEGVLEGTLMIDKATGLAAKVVLPDGSVVLEATALSLTEAQIPSFK